MLALQEDGVLFIPHDKMNLCKKERQPRAVLTGKRMNCIVSMVRRLCRKQGIEYNLTPILRTKKFCLHNVEDSFGRVGMR